MKKILPIMIALLLAAVASIGIVQATKKLTTQGAPVEIIVAARDLPKGATIQRQDLQTAVMRPPQHGAADAQLWGTVMDKFVYSDKINTLVGNVTTQQIAMGDPVMDNMYRAEREERTIVDWKMRISEGKRAISIPIDASQAVAGLIQVGDYVDILVTLPAPLTKVEEDKEMVSVPIPMGEGRTQTVQMPIGQTEGKPTTYYLLQKVEILAVGDQTRREEEVFDPTDPFAELTQANDIGSGITVAVSHEEALLFAYAISSADAAFVMTLRNPNDGVVYDPKNVTPANFEELLKQVQPQ
ncbi:MAG: Flp pilus assembly protein CpaB [Candidatus Sumerlaeota bacterium]